MYHDDLERFHSAHHSKTFNSSRIWIEWSLSHRGVCSKPYSVQTLERLFLNKNIVAAGNIRLNVLIDTVPSVSTGTRMVNSPFLTLMLVIDAALSERKTPNVCSVCTQKQLSFDKVLFGRIRYIVPFWSSIFWRDLFRDEIDRMTISNYLCSSNQRIIWAVGTYYTKSQL